MSTALVIDEKLLAEAQRLTGLKEQTELVCVEKVRQRFGRAAGARRPAAGARRGSGGDAAGASARCLPTPTPRCPAGAALIGPPTAKAFGLSARSIAQSAPIQ
jgi:Arc/MetJ family transcription regulator